MAKVTDHTRESVREDFTDSERYLRYYIDLADKFRTRYFLVRTALLAAVLLEAAIVIPVASRFQEGLALVAIVIVGIVVGVAVVVLTVVDATWDAARNSAKLTVVSDDIQLIYTDWRSLLSDIETHKIKEKEARRQQRVLLDRTNVVCGRVEINVDKARNVKFHNEAEQVIRERHA